MTWTFQQIAEITGGRVAAGRGELRSGPIRTDTRTIEPGATFLALRGNRFDGHRFAGEALQREAGGLILADLAVLPAAAASLPVSVVEVADTLRGLHALARAARRRPELRVVGITGSVGKTTTTAVVAAALAALGPVTATRGNWNNLVGLPLSMLELTAESRFGVFELGTNRPREIAELAAIAEPDAGIITAIGPAHLEFLGTEEGVFREKVALLESLPRTGWAILPAGSRWVRRLRERAPGPACAVGRGPRADVRWQLAGRDGNGWRVRFSDRQLGWQATGWVPGLAAHVAEAAAMALALASRWGGDVAAALAALARAPLPPMRMERHEIGGVTWIDDSYNANPSSMRAALEVLSNLPCTGRRILVVGDMLELGPASPRYHAQLGRLIRGYSFGAVFGCGPAARRTLAELGPPAGSTAGGYAESVDRLVEQVLDFVRPGDLVLVKASRGVGLDRLVRAARQREAVAVG